MKAYIVGGDKELINFLPEVELTNNFSEAKIVIFGDGPIVSPSLYKEKKIADVEFKCDINRDRSDKAIYTKLKPNQIAVGIGRGACFLAVMNGATLIQRVYKKNPNFSYKVELNNNGDVYVFSVISNWTQAINLLNCEDYSVVIRSKENHDYVADAEVVRFMKHNGNPELIKFHKEKKPLSICVQFHPEWIPQSIISKVVKEIIYEYSNK